MTVHAQAGKIILLNGVSSSGKSTIIREMLSIDNTIKVLKIDDWFPAVLDKTAQSFGWKKELGDPWLYLYEYVHKKTGNYYFNTQVREMLFDEVVDFYQQAKELADLGDTVVIDTVLEYEKEYTTFDTFFSYCKPIKVLVYCPMDVLLERVERRNNSGISEEHRTAFQSFEQFLAMFVLQTNQSEIIVDTIKSTVLKQALHKSVHDLLNTYTVSEPYVLKFKQFEQDFIKLFKLDEKEEIILVAKHEYDLVLNTSDIDSVVCAKKVISSGVML